MVNIEFGQIVFSKAGHDKETAYVVLGEEKGKIIFSVVIYTWASQVVLVVKNLPANAGDVRDADQSPRSG